MFTRFHEMRERRESGFTLIELLVVILIIAILAAIAIPVFLNQRRKGWRAQSQSALKNAATAAESYATANNGDYTGLDGDTGTELAKEGYSPISGVSLVVEAGANDYCLIATHAQLGGDDWEVSTYDSDEGEPKQEDTC